MKKFLSFALYTILLLSTASACQAKKGLEIKDPWARPGNKGGNSAIYFVVENKSATADSLLDATGSDSMMVQIHRSMMDASGMMMMQEQEEVPIPAGETVRFEPGGLHIMLMSLNKDLKVGDTVEITLAFKEAGSIKISAPIVEP